ncbi:unnamed protein product [Phytophthora fragariaefolia]|uniref:Unnamed protein product n=1 Tax=Phytophthora fragariaefolia TaxID=1490495 RepID=A0A9W6Y5J1_9STRA|nr:unnamed protein product [Phytophthora fragariaefolia]
MKLSNVLAISAAAVAGANAESYSEPDQAIWIDRHNYFRTTGLPWSAGNMRRIGWDADLATKAASTAQKCSATTSAGVNAFQSSATSASDAIDQAMQQWVVETGVSTIKTMAQPGTDDLDVGTGVYNSYSQVLWASTSSVGCATATCSGGELVVCAYSPAGNDGKSAWYKHAPQASQCPDNTVASGGLCIEEGNDANNQIASIPSGDYTYQVYPAFVADIHSILINSARDIANGSVPPSTATNSSSSTSTPSTAAPETLSKEDSTKQTASSPSSSSSSSSSSSPTQEESDLGPGTVKPSSDTGSTFQNEVRPPSSHKSSTKSSESATTTEQTELLTTNTKEGGAAEHGVSTLAIVSMFILGIGAVAGIVMFVHYRVSTQRQNDILLDGGVHK